VFNLLEKAPVKQVRKALKAAGVPDRIVKLKKSAETTAAIAASLGVEPGAIVKTQIYTVSEAPVLVMVAGDHVCKEDGLPRAMNLEGDVGKAYAAEVKSATGYNIGSVPPVALAGELPSVLDVSLKRFDKIYTPAGYAGYLFETTVDELKGLTGCLVSYNIAEPGS